MTRFDDNTTRRLRWAALVAVGAMIVTGCGDDDASTVGDGAASAALEEIETGTWVLDTAASTPSIADGRTTTLVVRAGVVHGAAPCNTYRGPVTVVGRDIEIGDLATTMRSCGDAVDRAETAYLGALTEVTAVDVDPDGRLVLSGDESVRLVFSPQDTADLLLGEWHVRNVVKGDALVSVMAGTDLVLTFADEGTLSMAMGCNTARSDWAIEGDQLSIGPVAQTKKTCDEPAGVMDQEAALVSALEASEQLEVSPDQLTLLTGTGTIALTAAADGGGAGS